MNVKIRENSLVARLAAAQMRVDKVAIVFGHTIHLHHTTREEFLADSGWVCHELKHVEQYRRLGFAGFLARYLAEWVRNGYFNNRFEQEARAAESDGSLLRRVIFT